MNRREFLTSLSASGLAAAVAGPALAATAAAPVERDTPAVYAPTSDGATILWPVSRASAGWVEYGEAGSSAPGKIARDDGLGFVPHEDRVLRVRLSGLQPGQRYWFKTHTRPVVTKKYVAAEIPVTSSKAYGLRTLNPAAATTSFCVWNDTHDKPATLARLAELTRAEPADFLVWNGDLGNYLADETTFAGLFIEPKGGVDLAEGPPIFLSRGNHDVRGPAANQVAHYVAFPEGRPYYSFRSGPVAGIVLDTGEDKPDAHPLFLGLVDFEPLIQEQARWLAREIEQPHLKSAPYRVVFCHIPLRWKTETTPTYDAAGNGFDHFSRRGREAWHDSLARWGAQMIISGHTHAWQHLKATNEFPYEQLVGGGPSLDERTSQALLIRASADAQALTLRLINASAKHEIYQTALAPRT
jgi:hypothetical protein